MGATGWWFTLEQAANRPANNATGPMFENMPPKLLPNS